MKRIVHGDPVVDFVEAEIGFRAKPDRLAIGLHDGVRVVAGVVFDQRWQHDVNVSAALMPGSVTRTFAVAVFRLAFEGLDVRRLSLGVRRHNLPAMEAARRLGFKCEGIQRGGYRNGDDKVLFGMLKKECRWLNSR